MTAKEKAKELVDNFRGALSHRCATVFMSKILANICVDEILDNFGLTCEGNKHYCTYSTILFYKEVKKEIELL